MAVVKIGQAVALYIDGQQVGYDSFDATYNFSAPVWIGDTSWTNDPYDGYMDDLFLTENNYFAANPNAALTDALIVPTSEKDLSGPVPIPGPLAALAGCIWVSSLILHRSLKVHKLNSEL